MRGVVSVRHQFGKKRRTKYAETKYVSDGEKDPRGICVKFASLLCIQSQQIYLTVVTVRFLSGFLAHSTAHLAYHYELRILLRWVSLLQEQGIDMRKRLKCRRDRS